MLKKLPGFRILLNSLIVAFHAFYWINATRILINKPYIITSKFNYIFVMIKDFFWTIISSIAIILYGFYKLFK